MKMEKMLMTENVLETESFDGRFIEEENSLHEKISLRLLWGWKMSFYVNVTLQFTVKLLDLAES